MRHLPVATGVAASFLAACAVTPAPAPDRPQAPDEPARRYRLAATAPLAIAGVAADSATSYNPPRYGADGVASSAWSNGGYRNPAAWLRLTFMGDVAIASASVRMPPAAAGTSYDLQVSPDGTTWTTAAAGLKNTTWNYESKPLPAGTHGRYMRLFWRNSASAPQPHVAVYELVAYGTAGSPGPTTAPTATPSAAPTATPTPGASATPTPVPTASTSYPRAATPGPRTVTGFVYNNRVPVAGITIKVGSQTLTTDANGRYTATNLPNGSYQAYYYNCCDRNKIGYWRSRPVAVDGTKGASVPTVDLYLVGLQNTPPMDARVKLPYTFVWKPPMQLPVGYYWRIHDRPYTSFVLVYQSSKLPGSATSFTFGGTGLDPAHRYFWGVQWDWGELGQGGNLYQAAYFSY